MATSATKIIGDVVTQCLGTLSGVNYVGTYTPITPTLTVGKRILFTPNTNSPAGATLDGVLIKKATDTGLINLVLNDLDTGGIYDLTYNGTNWLIDFNASSTNIPAWATSSVYAVNQPVRNEGRIYTSNISQVAGATFNGDRANWSVVKELAILTWSATTYYYANDIVKQGNNYIQRISSGTSGATYNTAEAILWNTVSSPIVSAWTASTLYLSGQLVTYAGRTLQKIATGNSTATFDLTESALWTVTDRRPTLWVVGTYYEIEDQVITQSTTGNLLQVVVPHTAVSLTADIAKFTVSTTSGKISTWTGSRAYYIGDMVTQGNRVLRKTTAGVSVATFTNTEAGFWALVSNEIPTPWVATTYYYAGERVTFGGYTLQLVTSGISGVAFGTAEAALWVVLEFKLLSTWVASTHYYAGTQVFANGQLLRAGVGATSQATFDLTESANWLFVSNTSISAWSPTSYYYAGCIVSNNGVLYQRNTSGLSAVTFTVVEQSSWRVVGDTSIPFPVTTQTKTASFPLSATDGTVEIAPASVTIVTLPSTMPVGKKFTFHGIISTVNTVSFTPNGGGTIASPVTFLPVSSFTMPGTTGQYWSFSTFLDKNNVWQVLQ